MSDDPPPTPLPAPEALSAAASTVTDRHFRLEEFKALKAEIIEETKAAERSLVFSATSTAAILAWLFLQSGQIVAAVWVFLLVALLPCCLDAVLAARWWFARKRTLAKAHYLLHLERDHFLGGDAVGWETLLQLQIHTVDPETGGLDRQPDWDEWNQLATARAEARHAKRPVQRPIKPKWGVAGVGRGHLVLWGLLSFGAAAGAVLITWNYAVNGGRIAWPESVVDHGRWQTSQD